MNRKFSIIYKYSILNKVKSKSFIALTVIFFLISLAVSLVPAYIDSISEPTKVGVVASEESNYNMFEANALAIYSETVFEKTTSTEDFEKTYDIVVDIDTYTVYSYEADLDMEDQAMIEVLFSRYNTALIANELNLTNEDVTKILTPPEMEFVNLGDNKGSASIGTFTWVFNYGYTIIGMLVLMIGSQFLGQEIMEEKTTRAMEVIMTSVSAGVHMLAKILSNLTFISIILLQGVVFVWIGSKITSMIFPDSGIQTIELILDGIQSMINEGSSNLSAYFLIFVIVVLLLLTLLTLLTFVSAIASSVTTVEEFQNSFGAATMIIMACYMASLFVTSIDVRIILSYIPIMNFFMLPGLMLSGNLGIVNIVISLSISIAFYFVVYLMSIKIYRAGVLNYSAKGVLKVFKQAFGFKIK